jgi:hypothetical protein
MGTNSYLSSIWIALEAGRTLWRIMEKSHNRSRFGRLEDIPMHHKFVLDNTITVGEYHLIIEEILRKI